MNILFIILIFVNVSVLYIFTKTTSKIIKEIREKYISILDGIVKVRQDINTSSETVNSLIKGYTQSNNNIVENLLRLKESCNTTNTIQSNNIQKLRDLITDNFTNNSGDIKDYINEIFNRQSQHIDNNHKQVCSKITINHNDVNNVYDEINNLRKEVISLNESIKYIKDFVHAKKNHRKVNKDPGNTCCDNCKKD